MKKVLIVKIGAIGDVVMALPLLPALKEEEAALTWVCGTVVSPLLKATELVDTLVEVNEQKLFRGNFFQKCVEVVKVWWRLKKEVFDLIIVAHQDTRYRLLTWGVRGKKRTYFSRTPEKYHVTQYLSLIGKEKGHFPHLAIPSFAPFKNFIVIAPGGAKNLLRESALRRWPIHHYVKLVKLLNEKGFKVVLTGSDEDAVYAPYFTGLNVENFIGKTSLLELVDLYKNASLLITHDSAPLHLAKLAGVPCIALFGPTNPKEFVSNEEKIHVIWGGEDLPCRPCYNGKEYFKCENNQCLGKITPEYVLERVICKIVSP